MTVFSIDVIDMFVRDRNAPRVFGQSQLPLATSWRNTSDATITSFATSDAGARARESCKPPPIPPSSATRSITRTNSSSSTASNSSAASEASSVSTAPSTGSNHPQITLEQQLLTMSDNGSNLPCIFVDILFCEHSNFDDFDSWFEHIVGHFGPSGPPPHALCVFCTSSFENENATACWDEYLEHIKWHFERGNTLDRYRPDFGVLKSLRDKGMMTEADYADLCNRGSERPRLPGLLPLDCEPEEMVAKKRAQEEASNRIIVSEPRRRRDQQRSPRGKKPSPAVIYYSQNETS
ncbi:hypothetical protein V492_01215 [Pseudogymnoascus sp. VKM F-4246]|nr:hypothetical protein V492_01215 [Pseudogymnoascus sp. VKM F-4246]